MKNKAIKILIVSFVFISYLLSVKNIFAYAEPYSYEIDGMRVYVNYGSRYQQEDYNSREEDEDKDEDNYNDKIDNRNYENPQVNNTKTSNSSSSASANSQGGSSVINNYYSLFSSFGSKTSTDNSTSSNSSNKVATTDKTTTKSQDNTKTTLSSDSKNINDSRYDSRYGGAIDTTGSRLGASAYGSNFTPNTFWGWFISIILILAIIIVVRIIMRPKEKEVKKANS